MNSVKPYEHTQMGWVILVASLLPVLALLPLAMSGVPPTVVLAILGLMLVIATLFASLTVGVDARAITLKFGIGVFRRRIDLAEVRAFGEVDNPWYWGWGIRWYPGGKLYNVSGSTAVELELRNKRRVRVGTDEPQALCAARPIGAIESALGACGLTQPTPSQVGDCCDLPSPGASDGSLAYDALSGTTTNRHGDAHCDRDR
jgi:hypothetical protein